MRLNIFSDQYFQWAIFSVRLKLQSLIVINYCRVCNQQYFGSKNNFMKNLDRFSLLINSWEHFSWFVLRERFFRKKVYKHVHTLTVEAREVSAIWRPGYDGDSCRPSWPWRQPPRPLWRSSGSRRGTAPPQARRERAAPPAPDTPRTPPLPAETVECAISTNCVANTSYGQRTT